MLLAAAVLAGLMGPAVAQPPAGDRGSSRNRAGKPAFVERELLVAFDPGAEGGERAAVRRRHGLERVEGLPLPGLERVRLRGRGGPPARGRAVAAERAVRYAEPNHVWQVDAHGDGLARPDDPGFAELWGLHNEGQTGGTHGADIDYLAAHRVASYREGVVAGVTDTGVAVDHPDLAENVWVNAGELPVPLRLGGSGCRMHDCDGDGAVSVDDYADDPRVDAVCRVDGAVRPSSLRCAFSDGDDSDGNGFVDDILGWDFRNDDNDPADGHGHGTHVAGTAGAVADNAVGMAGTSQARLMALKFLSDGGSGSTADAVKALDYALAMGAAVTNNSWGGSSPSEALSEKIREAHAEGQLFVASAGNSGDNIDQPGQEHYPASFNHPNMVTVAATTDIDDLAGSSNYGPRSVHLGAPGSGIYSTLPGGDVYGRKRGTSMAAPHVASAAAAVFAGYPGIDHIEVKDRVVERGDMLRALLGKTTSGKRLNLAGALDTDGSPALSEVQPSPHGFVAGDEHTTLRWTQNEPAGVTIRIHPEGEPAAPVRTTTLGPRSTGPHTWAWDGTDDADDPVHSDDYTLAVAATDAADSTTTETATVTTESRPEANLRAWVGGSRDPVPAGEELTYDARVRNLGPSGAEDVKARARLPRELTDVSLDGPASSDCSYDAGNHAVFCDFGALNGDDVRRVLIVGVVDGTTPDGTTLRFTYEATSPTHDPDPRIRSFTRTTEVTNN